MVPIRRESKGNTPPNASLKKKPASLTAIVDAGLISGVALGGVPVDSHVDGRNPAPVDMVNISLFLGYYTSQVGFLPPIVFIARMC